MAAAAPPREKRRADLPPDEQEGLLLRVGRLLQEHTPGEVEKQLVNEGYSAAEAAQLIAEAQASNGKASARAEARANAPKHGLTDLGNARRLVHRHGHDLRYVNGLGWFVWDGSRWASDNSGEVMRRAKATAIGIFEEAARDVEDERRKKLGAWAVRSEGRAALSNMIALAESELGIAILPDALDSHPWKLNVANGTVDLTTGELLPHDPAELHTKIAGAAYDAGAAAPLWDKFLAEILPNAEVRAFVQKFMGYCLTGSVREQALAFLWGAGSNGKTTFLEAVREAMGDYAHQAGGDLLVAKRERSAGDMAAIASLRGRRLVTTLEVDDGVRLAEGLVKELTGERTIIAKLMRRDPVEFENVSKICLAANHKPEVRGQDFAMWRRIKLIPFTVTIPDERKDANLGEKLAQERDGILGWLVEGCLAYQRDGLGEPAVIKAATAEPSWV
jgi:putative DNA primase/helicase